MYKLFFCRTLAHPPRTLGTAVSSPTPLTSCSSPWSVRSLIISAVWGWWSLIVINTDNKDCSLNSNKNIELMAAFETMMLGMKIGLPVLNLGIDTSTITACYASRPLHQAEHMIRKTIFFLLQFFFFRSKQQWSCLVWNRLGLLGLAGHFERVPGERKKTMFLMIIQRKCWHQHQKMCEPLVKVDPTQSQQENEVSSEMPELWHLKGVDAQTPVYSRMQYSISIQ